MVRSANTLTPVRGRSTRVTRLDNCGRIVVGSYNQAVSEGVTVVAFTANTVDTDEINVPNFAGKRCVFEPSVTELAGYGLTLTFCRVDFEYFEIMTKQTLVLDAAGNVTGLEIDTAIELDDEGFALEVWVGSQGADVCDDPNAQGEYGYMLLPRVVGGIVGDVSIENGAINFQITGANTREGNQWGKGPYPVEMVGGTDEVQRITISGTPTGGTFTVTYDGQTTAAIAYNAAASAVQSALEALSNIGVGDVLVTGGPGPGTPYTIQFTGSLAKRDVNVMTATSSLTGGTTPAVAVTVITPGVNATPGALYQAVSKTAAFRLMVSTVAPPTEAIGARPVLNSTLPALGTLNSTKNAADTSGRTVDFTITTPAATGPVWYDFGDLGWDYVAAPGTTSHRYDADGTYTVLASQNGINWASKSVTIPHA